MLFDEVNFTLAAGEALHVSGPNGSGKSSLIRLAAGLLEAASGVVRRGGAAALADDNLALDRELPLGRALHFWATGPADQGLAMAGLCPLAHVPVRLLSSGQRKRATLARVFGSGAPLWLLDEPANALDEAGIALLDQAIAKHRASGGAVVAASHSPLAGEWKRLELKP